MKMRTEWKARFWLVLALAVCVLQTAVWATPYTWTGSGGDANWTTTGNWDPSTGYPSTTSDTATFTNSTDADVNVDDDIAIGNLNLKQNPHVTNTITIASGKTFQPYHVQAYNVTITNTTLVEGGTFKPRPSAVIVGYQNSSAGSPYKYPNATLILTNTIFDTGNLTGASDGLLVGVNFWSVGRVIGLLDARGADIRYNGVQNLLQVPRLWVGYRFTGINVGRIALPPAITNITATSLLMRGTQPMPAWIDLGQDPQLQTLKIVSEARIANGYIRYRDAGGTARTNLPPDTALIIGASDARAVFDFGVSYNTTTDLRWGGFRRFEGYFSEFNIGRLANSMTAYAELDLTTVDELAGDITTNNVDTPILRLGGGPRYGTGVLKLPGTVTNLAFDTFYLGDVPDLSGPPYSVLDIGSNTQLRAITVRDDFRIGRGEFQYVDSGGTPHTGLPGGVAFRAGAEDQRAAFRVGNCHYINTTTVFGPGLATFEAWLSELWIGKPSAGWANHSTSSTLDLRGVDVVNLDVDGAVTMGTGIGDQSTFYLSSSPMRCYTFTVGRDGHVTLSYNRVSTLNLSNAVMTVTNQATLKQTGLVLTTLDGSCSGLDLLTTNLVVAEPFVTHPQYYGHIDLDFKSDPVDPQQDYWGLRLQGNATSHLQSLTSAVPPRLTWDISALSSFNQERFGIHYDAANDRTFVGLPRLPSGTLILVR